MRLERVLGGAALLFVDALIFAFLATANYSAVGDDLARVITLLVLVYLAFALLVLGLRLVRSGGRRGH